MNNGYKKKIILESPVLKSHTGTLYAAVNWARHYSEPKQSALVNKFLDTFCFTKEYTEGVQQMVKTLKDKNEILVMTSRADGVCDIEGLEDHHHHIFDKGRHARLFAKGDNDHQFSIIADFLASDTKQNECQ